MLNMGQLGHKLKQLREGHGWGQSECARQVGMDRATYVRLEQGRKPRVEGETIVRLCHALGCTSDYLLGLSGEADAEDAA